VLVELIEILGIEVCGVEGIFMKCGRVGNGKEFEKERVWGAFVELNKVLKGWACEGYG